MFAVSLAGTVAAQEVCVECSGPGASYKCSVKDGERLGQSRNGGRALEYVCITELAKAGGHESCRASRDFAGPCIGRERVLDLARPAGQSAVVVEPGAEVGEPAVAAPKPPPNTLEELARDTVAKSKEQLGEADQKMKDAAKNAGVHIEKAGSAVGDVVKKSVGCLVSLFTKC